MNRILVSPKALSVASLLRDVIGTRQTVRVLDADIAVALSLQPNTVYKALMELRAVGALSFGAATPGAPRTVTLNRSHWLWTAVTQLDGQATS